jgi:Platelet-activating factor acetylhydrolase, isoform II
MRPGEILLVVANFLTFVVFAVPRIRAIRWTGYVVLITLALAVVQVLVEGPRWQMVPAYVLTGLFLVVWTVQRVAPAGGSVKQILTKRVVVGCAIVLCILGMGLSAALPIVLPVFHFPRPSGPYQIGTVTYHWVESRHELFSTDPNAHRELMAQVWYPVKGDTSSLRAPYVQDASALSSAAARAVHLPWFTFDHFQYVTTNAIPSAPMATDTPNYPVLIFLTGIDGFRQSNTFQIEELVSHGYIVVGIDQPYAAASVVFPDGHQINALPKAQMDLFTYQSLSPVANAPMLNGKALKDGNIPYFAQDVSFTLDQLTALNKADPNGILTGRLDLQRVGTFGISLGAMVASEACHMDSRLKACLMMDAAMPADVVQAGLRQPSMWLTRPASDMRLENWKESDITQTLNTMRAVFNEEPAGDGYYVSVPGMFHVNFTDAPYFTPLGPLLGFTGPINAQRGFDIVNAYSLAFFDKELKGQQTPLLNGPSKQYPEVNFEKRGP